jgi:hypothetical protein
MTTFAEIFEALAAPFPPEAVSWRTGSTNIDKQTNKPRGDGEPRGMALAYLDARDVMGRLDEVMTPGGWERRHPHVSGTTTCELTLILPDGTRVTKTDGAGDTDVEREKGSLSDSFKRAAVNWGVGRYLYGLPSPWVALESAGRSWKIKDEEYRKLEDMLAKVTGDIEWGSPGEKTMARALYQTIKSTVQTADDVRRYREANAGVLALLRKAPREQIEMLLERIIETSNTKAA